MPPNPPATTKKHSSSKSSKKYTKEEPTGATTMVEYETKDDEATKEVSAEEPKAMMPTKTKSEVTVDADTGVTTVEEIEEIDDDDEDDDDDNDNDDKSGRSVEDIQVELENELDEEAKKYKPDEKQVEEIKAARAKAKTFLSESGKFLNSVGVDPEDGDDATRGEKDAFLGEKEERSKKKKIKDMNAYLDNILSDDYDGGKDIDPEMTPEQDKAVKAEIAYAMDETKPAMTDAQKDLMASYQLMLHVGNAN